MLKDMKAQKISLTSLNFPMSKENNQENVKIVLLSFNKLALLINLKLALIMIQIKSKNRIQ